MEANTCEKADFLMPNYILSKAAKPMNSNFERAMFIPKFSQILPCKNLSKKGQVTRVR